MSIHDISRQPPGTDLADSFRAARDRVHNRPPPWNCHEHRDELQVSSAATVYHVDHGQLCQCESRGTCILYHPIRFESRAKAHQWIESGCIADLQEGLANLGVGFSKVALETR